MVSPIEALRINTTDTPATEKTRIEHRKITPSSLARMSFARNKKKAILTVLSLGFAGVLLMCAATYLNSTDVESMAKQQFANGDIVLSLDPANTNAEDRPAGINALQTKNPLDEVLEETISDMNGVKNIEFIQGCVSNMEFPTPFKDGNSHFFTQIGIPENQYEAFSQGLIEGTADRQKLINGKGVIVDNSAKLLSDYYNYTPQIGDMKKINFCKATTIILIINVILSIVLFFVVPDKIAIQWVGTSPSNAVDSYYVFLVPVLSVLFAFTGKPIFTMFLFRLWNRTNEHLVTYLNLCLQVVFLTCEIYIGLYNLCNFNVAISIILIVELMIDVVIGLKLFHNQSI